MDMKQVRRWEIFIGLFLLFITIFCIAISSALIQINVDNVTNDAILWSWNDTTVNRVLIDGHEQTDNLNLTYSHIGMQYRDILPTKHIIEVYSPTDYGFLYTTTLGDSATDKGKLMEIFVTWILIILAALFCFIGIYVPFVGFIGVIPSVLGITTSVNGSFTTLFVYCILFLASFVIGYSGGK